MDEYDRLPGVARRPWQPRRAEAAPQRVLDLEEAGRRIVDELRDQLADGQVETLLGMQSATAELRRTAEAVSRSARDAVDQARAVLEHLPALLEQAATSTVGLQQSVVDSATHRLGETVQQAVTTVTAGADAAAVRIAQTAEEAARRSDAAWVELLALNDRLNQDAEAAVARAAGAVTAAVQAVEDALPPLVEQVLDRARTAVEQQLEAAVVRLDGASTASTTLAAEAVASAADAAASRIAEAADETGRRSDAALAQMVALNEKLGHDAEAAVARAKAAVNGAVQTMEEALPSVVEETIVRVQQSLDEQVVLASAHIRSGGVAAAHEIGAEVDRLSEQQDAMRTQLGDLLGRLEAAEKRRDARVDARVGRLVDRSRDVLSEAGASLSGAAAQLAERDERLERQRAEQFVRVLDEVLTGAGLRRRRLRLQVLRAIAEPDTAGAPAPAAQPEAETPVEPVRLKRTRRTAAEGAAVVSGPKPKKASLPPDQEVVAEQDTPAPKRARRSRTSEESS